MSGSGKHFGPTSRDCYQPYPCPTRWRTPARWIGIGNGFIWPLAYVRWGWKLHPMKRGWPTLDPLTPLGWPILAGLWFARVGLLFASRVPYPPSLRVRLLTFPQSHFETHLAIPQKTNHLQLFLDKYYASVVISHLIVTHHPVRSSQFTRSSAHPRLITHQPLSLFLSISSVLFTLTALHYPPCFHILAHSFCRHGGCTPHFSIIEAQNETTYPCIQLNRSLITLPPLHRGRPPLPSPRLAPSLRALFPACPTPRSALCE